MPNITTNLGLKKPIVTENYDIAKVTNENADLLDADIGNKLYTENNYIVDDESLTTSINKLDIALKDVNDSDALKAPLANPTFTGTQTLPSIVTNGINFPATQVPSADANTLDDYEEGTFTPYIYGVTTEGVGTYSNQTGRYTKIGNVVVISIELVWSAHTGTGAMVIGGLPFSAVGLQVSIVYLVNIDLTSGYSVMCALDTTRIPIRQYSVSTNSQVNIDTAGTIRASATYIT